MLSDSTLIVVADGGVARFLSRARPGARLAELVDVRMGAEAMEPARDRPARAHDRMGAGRHAIERRLSPRDAAEAAFLQGVAEKTTELIRLNKISQLVLCAPPRALGVLRAALSSEASERLTLSCDLDITKETPSEIDERLRRFKT
jgi:protein required for attachment to host cells